MIAGAIGYWAFDNLVLWATFHAFGVSPPLTVILMGYLIGQLGGALPLPGGIGGIDLGLIGTLIVYGAPAAATAAAVLAYRIILFWLPLVVGGIAFGLLRRDMPTGQEFAACAPALAARSAARPHCFLDFGAEAAPLEYIGSSPQPESEKLRRSSVQCPSP